MYKQRKEFNLTKEEYTCALPEFDEPSGDSTEVKRKLARIHIPQNKAICGLFAILQKVKNTKSRFFLTALFRKSLKCPK